MKTKILILLSVYLCAFAPSHAQVRTDINLRDRNNSSYDIGEEGFNAHSFSVGVGLGMTKLYGDMPYSNPQPAYIGYFEKNISPFVTMGQQITIGDLSGRDDHDHMRSFNHFTALEEHVAFELGGLLRIINENYRDHLALSIGAGLYAGIGIGVINNDIKRIANKNYDQLNANIITSNPILLQNSTALYIPINVGFNFKMEKFLIFKGCIFNANFQYADCLSDYIDGYKLPFKANKKNDVYTVMSLGFKFYINHAGNTD